MKTHILDTSKLEIKKNNNFLQNYDFKGLKEKFLHFFGKDFRTLFGEYSSKKRDILMSYASLYNDIHKDFSTVSMSGREIQNINNSLIHITDNIKECAKSLKKITKFKHTQNNLVYEEEYFFVMLLESFNSDLHQWMSFHKNNIKDYIRQVDKKTNVDFEKSHKPYGEMIQKRLLLLVENIEKIQKK